MSKPFIIGIAGESGVGKSTIAEMVSLFFGVENTTVLSTDDLHKWERKNPQWKILTHLNPDANNLDLGDMHLADLAAGKSIFRSVYNHHTGCFDPPLKVAPKKYIITEGLHAFYTDTSKALTDLKIFIDTDESLRVHWKIIRDTEERGYTYNMVLESIASRRLDNEKIRAVQISAADVVIKMIPRQTIKCLGDKHEKIEMDLSIVFQNGEMHKELFDFIERYNATLNEFVEASELLGSNVELCQDNGGNISAKLTNKFMAVKASGFKLKDVGADHGFSVVDRTAITQSRLQHEAFETFVNSTVVSDRYTRPSMEVGFHAILDATYVIHLHPVYLTLLLCMENSKAIMSELFAEDYQYIEYVPPGYSLFAKIKGLSKDVRRMTWLYLLENHGIIVAFDDMAQALAAVDEVTEKAKRYLEEHTDFMPFSLSFADIESIQEHIFPDSVIFADNPTKRETRAVRNYIERVGNQLGRIRHLSHDDIKHLNVMEAEKYRKHL